MSRLGLSKTTSFKGAISALPDLFIAEGRAEGWNMEAACTLKS